MMESWEWTWLLGTLGRDGKPLVWVRPPILCIPRDVMGSSHCPSWARTSSSSLPEMALLVPAVLAPERMELLPKPSPYPAEAGFSGNPQIQTLRKLDLLFTSSRLATPSVSAPQYPHHSENVLPQFSSLLEPRRELSHAG